MKILIKKLLREQAEKYDTIEMIKNYKGKNNFLNDLRLRLVSRMKITNKQLETAAAIFKSEFYRDTILDQLTGSDKFRKLVTKLGTETYISLVKKTDDEGRPNYKKILLQFGKKVRVSSPPQNWKEKNISDLNFFKEITKKSNKKISFDYKKSATSISEECDYLIAKIENDEFSGFVEEENGKREWSILNRFNSHYTNWFKLISKRDKENILKGFTTEDKIKFYFSERNSNEFQEFIDILNSLGLDSEEKDKLYKLIPTLSYADIDIIKLVHEADDPTSDYDYNRMINRLKKTTTKGEEAETKFVKHLLNNGIPQTNIHVFSSYGNLVDITFQCDLAVKFGEDWIPIQVKSKEANSKLLTYDIGGLVVFPAPRKYKCGDWGYYDGKSFSKSFDEKYLNVSC